MASKWSTLKAATKVMGAVSKSSGECVHVVVRVRPMNATERNEGRQQVVHVDQERGEISVTSPEDGHLKNFTFDSAYGPESRQRQIYDITAQPIVQSVMAGFNGTIFAYGQTGAGKSHTMLGVPGDPEMQGIIPNSFEDIFDTIALNTDPNSQFLVRASYLEIYNDEIRDLLSDDPKHRLDLREDTERGVFVPGLENTVVKSVAEIDAVRQRGDANRSVGATKMNAVSSRSHSIFTITVETSEMRDDGQAHIRAGKLNLVDLAGSERQDKTGAVGDRFTEAKNINMSLTALGNVISALVDGKSSHIPYRDSKLTRLLQDSLGGNTRTTMIANCGPVDYNYKETLSTLRYANRAKNIKNKPKINEDPKDAMLREFQEEIERLRQQLAAQGGGGVGGAVGAAGAPQVIVEKVIVEKEIGAEVIEQVKAAAASETERLRREMEAQARQAMAASAQTEAERKRLAEALAQQANLQAEHQRQQEELRRQYEDLQKALIAGGREIDQAAKKEAELRQQQSQLQRELEERKRQEAAKQAELEEANIMIEEKYNSLADEVEAKRKKLRKLWTKYKTAKEEIRDLTEEFQSEREDLLETVRQLRRELGLKQLIIDNFVPMSAAQRIEAMAIWNDKLQAWMISEIQHAGNRVIMRPSLQNGRPDEARKKNRARAEGAAAGSGNAGNESDRYNGMQETDLAAQVLSRTTKKSARLADPAATVESYAPPTLPEDIVVKRSVPKVDESRAPEVAVSDMWEVEGDNQDGWTPKPPDRSMSSRSMPQSRTQKQHPRAPKERGKADTAPGPHRRAGDPRPGGGSDRSSPRPADGFDMSIVPAIPEEGNKPPKKPRAKHRHTIESPTRATRPGGMYSDPGEPAVNSNAKPVREDEYDDDYPDDFDVPVSAVPVVVRRA